MQTVNFSLAAWEAVADVSAQIQEQFAISVKQYSCERLVDPRRCVKKDHSVFKDYSLGEECRKYAHFPQFLLCQMKSLCKIRHPEGGTSFPPRKAFLFLPKPPCFLLGSWVDSCLPTSWVRQFNSNLLLIPSHWLKKALQSYLEAAPACFQPSNRGS